MLWFPLPSINSLNNGWAWGIVPIMRKEELWRHNTNLLSKNAFRVSMTTLWAATNLPYQEGWVGRWFKISKNCPVGRNKITTEWLDIWSWELCKLVKSLHTTPGHPKHQLTWGEKLLASIVSSLLSCNLAYILPHLKSDQWKCCVLRKLDYIQCCQNTNEWLHCGIFGWPCSFVNSVIRYLLVISHWTLRIKFVTLFFNTSVILILLFLLWRLLILTWPLQKLSRLQEKWTLMVRLKLE